MRSTTILLATAALALATTGPVAAKQKATPCSGRFVLDQGKMALGTTESAPVVDAVTLDAGGVMISQACGFKQAQQAATRKGWKVRARWKQCGDAKQIDLRATLDKACTTLDGRIDVRKPKIKKRKFGAATCGENGSNSSAAPKSTWDSIQTRVFAPHGCTDQLCHGSAAGAAQSGGLDLRPEVAYENLIDVPASTGTLKRIFPGDQLKSQLWLKVAKATLGTSDDVGTGMPVGLPPLTPDELEALKVWIRGGAPKTGVVPHTAELLGACLPKNTPNKMRPAAPPAAGAGVQFYAPPWPVEAHGENEICYPTYYDFSNDPNVPKFPCDPANPSGDQCFAYRGTDLTQSPNSHHSIIHSYGGPNRPDDPAWGAWTCLGGDKAGQACDPRQPNATECPGGGCAGAVKKSFACIGYGPSDFAGSGLGSGIGGSQQPYEEIAFPDGVYSVLPAKGIIVWNSHAFNLTDDLETTEQWFNVYFAPERVTPMLQVFDAADIFIMNVPPFEKREYCRTLEPFPFVGIEFPQNSCLFRLSSHNHKRGVLFRTWGPGIPDRCTSRCQGTYAPNQVPRGCANYCPNGVCNPCEPEPGEPILRTTDYSDPDERIFDPPLCLTNPDPAMRRFKFCAVYDNGFADPATVKRKSLAPPASQGSCTNAVIACVNEPNRGKLCHGNNSECDSAPNLGDGVCDACPVRGQETTDDEMMIQIGNWYIPSPSPAFLDAAE